ncbi:unnamed protein product [Cunninghamella blakesleeana]
MTNTVTYLTQPNFANLVDENERIFFEEYELYNNLSRAARNADISVYQAKKYLTRMTVNVLVERNKTLENRNNTLKNKLNKTKNELKECKKKLDECKEYKEEINKYKEEINKYKEEINKYREEVKEYKKKIKEEALGKCLLNAMKIVFNDHILPCFNKERDTMDKL